MHPFFTLHYEDVIRCICMLQLVQFHLLWFCLFSVATKRKSKQKKLNHFLSLGGGFLMHVCLKKGVSLQREQFVRVVKVLYVHQWLDDIGNLKPFFFSKGKTNWPDMKKGRIHSCGDGVIFTLDCLPMSAAYFVVMVHVLMVYFVIVN